MQSLSPALGRLESLLQDAGGAFVAGQTLAKAVGIPMVSLSTFVGQLRRQRPDLVIEGRSGQGYRVVLPTRPEQPKPARQRNAAKPRGSPVVPPKAAIILDLIPPRLAETVRTIALESGETVEMTAERLIAYGAEVHRDLVSNGENPLALRRSRRDSRQDNDATCH